jgi:hypothetical protein
MPTHSADAEFVQQKADDAASITVTILAQGTFRLVHLCRPFNVAECFLPMYYKPMSQQQITRAQHHEALDQRTRAAHLHFEQGV